MAPLGGLEASGWRLAYRGTVGSVQAARARVNATVEERFSIGLLARVDGTVVDVVRNSASWRAGLGPAMQLWQSTEVPGRRMPFLERSQRIRASR